MRIINNENYFSNKQLEEILNLFDKDYIPKDLIICGRRFELIKICRQLDKGTAFSIMTDITVWNGKTEAEFIEKSDTILVYVFAQNDDGEDQQSKQLYSLHALAHELRHRYYTYNQIKIMTEKEEEDCDRYATDFIRKRSKIISKIMEWEDEWDVEEW